MTYDYYSAERAEEKLGMTEIWFDLAVLILAVLGTLAILHLE